MANRKQWYFAPNNNGVVDGFNDSGIEMFSSHSLASMVREVIQNSLDQQVDEHKPVVVDFHRFQVTKDEIPGGSQLKAILQKCLETANGDKSVEKFFEQALHLINKRTINVLRISDHNTTGLRGAETGKIGTSWHQLVKSRGASNKSMNAGGSFGIGKSATLACSYFHTIFYASKAEAEDKKGTVDSYIGVSRLLSFERERAGKKETTVGTGFYSGSEKMNAILETLSLDREYLRQDDGLDIYILALEDDANFKQTMLHAVLENFFITIEQKRLVVNVDDETIERDNLAQYIAQMDDKKDADIKNYYDLLIHCQDDPGTYRVIKLNADEYGKDFDIEDGECTLYLGQQDDDLNRRILMTRKTGMTLFQQSSFASGISFTGILQITGKRMNEIFKAMEVPAHDKWEPGRCKVDKTFYEKAYRELRQYLRQKVQECFGTADGDIEYVSDLDEFFSAGVGEGQTEISLKERKPKAKIQRRKTKKNKRKGEIKPNEEFGGEVVKDGGVNEPNPKPKPPKPPKTPRPKKSAFKFRSVKKRLIAKDLFNGLYTLNFTVPSNAEKVRLEFVGIAERGNYDIPIYNVSLTGNDTDLTLDKANATFGPVKKGQEIRLDFSVGFGGPMMMEVNYYEAK